VLAGHDRYEALAGAIALGEATPAERAVFDAHAVSCARCRADAAAAGSLAGVLENERAAELWRPSIGAAVERRIRETRRSRQRFSIVALGWCVALSLAVDVAFAGGFAGRFERAFEARDDSAGVAVSSPARPAPLVSGRQAGPLRGAVVARRRTAGHAHPAFRVAAQPQPRAPVSPPVTPAYEADVPDVLAGLDLSGTAHHSARSVALEAKQPPMP
jgi:hypothetical protein